MSDIHIHSLLPLSAPQRAVGAMPMLTIERALKAIAQFRKRQLRFEDPVGTLNKYGCFIPSPEEDCGVTKRIREPDALGWANYLRACRSYQHCCDLNKVSRVDATKVRKVIYGWKDIPWSKDGVFEEVLSVLREYHEQYRLEQYEAKKKGASKKLSTSKRGLK